MMIPGSPGGYLGEPSNDPPGTTRVGEASGPWWSVPWIPGITPWPNLATMGLFTDPPRGPLPGAPGRPRGGVALSG